MPVDVLSRPCGSVRVCERAAIALMPRAIRTTKFLGPLRRHTSLPLQYSQIATDGLPSTRHPAR